MVKNKNTAEIAENIASKICHIGVLVHYSNTTVELITLYQKFIIRVNLYLQEEILTVCIFSIKRRNWYIRLCLQKFVRMG